jgi:hypothetical protein
MTRTDPARAPGYRGSLPTREDRLARPWVLTVIGIFVLIIVLSLLGIPSRLIPDPTPIPLPSTSALPSESAGPSTSASASASAEASASPEPSPSGE